MSKLYWFSKGIFERLMYNVELKSPNSLVVKQTHGKG